jgi:hypothetical protein
MPIHNSVTSNQPKPHTRTGLSFFTNLFYTWGGLAGKGTLQALLAGAPLLSPAEANSQGATNLRAAASRPEEGTLALPDDLELLLLIQAQDAALCGRRSAKRDRLPIAQAALAVGCRWNDTFQLR